MFLEEEITPGAFVSTTCIRKVQTLLLSHLLLARQRSITFLVFVLFCFVFVFLYFDLCYFELVTHIDVDAAMTSFKDVRDATPFDLCVWVSLFRSDTSVLPSVDSTVSPSQSPLIITLTR